VLIKKIAVPVPLELFSQGLSRTLAIGHALPDPSRVTAQIIADIFPLLQIASDHPPYPDSLFARQVKPVGKSGEPAFFAFPPSLIIMSPDDNHLIVGMIKKGRYLQDDLDFVIVVVLVMMVLVVGVLVVMMLLLVVVVPVVMVSVMLGKCR
jgi:hypothetical protein